MRIDSVESFPVRVKLQERLQAGSFSYGDYMAVLIKATCDGEVGWGEAMTRSSPKATSILAEDYLGPMVVGQKFGTPEAAWRKIWNVLRIRGHTRGIDVEALSGIEMAFQDAYARLRGRPLARLLSGGPATSVAAYAGSLFESRGTIEAQVEAAKTRELKGAKVKIGFGVQKDISVIRKVRRFWEDGEIVADANGAYDSSKAIKLSRSLEEFELAWLEEPVPSNDFEGYRMVAYKRAVPIGAGESWFPSDFDAPIEEKLIDVLEPSVSRCGGVSVSWQVSRKALRKGIAYSPMVGMNSAVSLAASLQLAAASGNAKSIEFNPFGNPLVDELCPEFPVLRHGRLQLPKGDGFGVAVDMNFIRKHLVG